MVGWRGGGTHHACPSSPGRSCSPGSSALSRTSHLCPSSCSCSSTATGNNKSDAGVRSGGRRSGRNDPLQMTGKEEKKQKTISSLQRVTRGPRLCSPPVTSEQEVRTHVVRLGLRHRHPFVDAEGRVSYGHPFLLPVKESEASEVRPVLHVEKEKKKPSSVQIHELHL